MQGTNVLFGQIAVVFGIVIAGVWGMETNFGSMMGNNYVITALATLAHAQYRGPFFRNELLTASTGASITRPFTSRSERKSCTLPVTS